MSASLRDAYLREADLRQAELSFTNIQGANLGRADLQKADLSFTNLQNANLRNANLQKADLSGANLQGAILIDLIETKNLTPKQVKSACFWEKAIYKGKWNREKKVVLSIEPDNNNYIEELKNDKASDPDEPIDCSRS